MQILSLTPRRLSGERETFCREASEASEQIEDMNKQIQIARQNYDLEKASELQYGELPKLQQKSWKSKSANTKRETEALSMK